MNLLLCSSCDTSREEMGEREGETVRGDQKKGRRGMAGSKLKLSEK